MREVGKGPSSLGVGVGGGGEDRRSVVVNPTPDDYLAIGDVDRQINVPEGARPDLPYQFIFPSDNEFGLGAAAARHPERRRRRRGPSPDTSERRTEASGLVPGARLRRRAAGNGKRWLGVTRPGISRGGPDRRRSLRFLLAGPQFVRGSRGY